MELKKIGNDMFITFEGIEGSGKSTQAKRMADQLNQTGLPCILTREPGGESMGKRIRSLLLATDSRGLDPVAELLLYLADRVQHINRVVLPALQKGKMVISDRYFDATLAYQGYAKGLDNNLILKLHELLCPKPRPSVTFLLDLPVEDGLSRAWKDLDNGARDISESRFETESLEFHERVRKGYLDIAGRNQDRFRIIDATPDENTVQESIRLEFSFFRPVAERFFRQHVENYEHPRRFQWI